MKEGDACGRRDFLRRLPRLLLEKVGAAVRRGADAYASIAEGASLPRDLVARVEIALCHAWSGLMCQQCYLACPRRDRALEMREQKPLILASDCDGCALCVTACETVNDRAAIRMVPREGY